METLSKSCFFIKKNGCYQKLCIEDIQYLEANGDYVNIVVDKKTQFLVRNSLSKIELLLPINSFLKIHRSYIVKLEAIDFINFTEGIVEVGGKVLPMSRQNRKKLNDLIVKLD